MSIRRLTLLALLASCQGGSTSSKQEEPRRTAAPSAGIVVKDAKGTVTATVSRDKPCRARVDEIEIIVGTRPIVATIGAVKWTGDDDNGGTLIRRDGEPVARVAPMENALGVFDPAGVAIVRATQAGDTVRVASGAGRVLRTATRGPSGIAVGDQVVTGTDDLLLAAVLAAPEARPEVRAMTACLRAIPPAAPAQETL